MRTLGPNKHRKSLLHLSLGQIGAQAVVGTGPEGELLAGIGPADVEPVRVVEYSWVTVGAIRA